jgi:hypothetical protein
MDKIKRKVQETIFANVSLLVCVLFNGVTLFDQYLKAPRNVLKGVFGHGPYIKACHKSSHILQQTTGDRSEQFAEQRPRREFCTDSRH